jgi:hypothetical protein
LIEWVVTFSVIVAAIIFLRAPINRALQTKAIQMTDYMFWKKWGQNTQQYKGDDTSFIKTTAGQDLSTRQAEREGKISNSADSVATENTASSSVEEGSQPLLKTINLNDLPPQN